ncbi:MAG: hypothetical protein IPI67_14095 [Myxococcales bacterium]|nr:hypothetical protein [Myxococcales bacterium]
MKKQSAKDDADALQSDNKLGDSGCSGKTKPAACSDLADAVDRAKSSGTISTIGFIGAGVGAAGFVAFMLMPGSNNKTAVYPLLDQHTAGLAPSAASDDQGDEMKKMGFAFVLAAVASGGGLIACGGDNFDSCEATSTCPQKDGGTGGSGGTSGTGGTGGTGNTGGTSGTGGTGNTGGTAGSGGVAGGDSGTCDPTKSPGLSHALIADDYGVFVSPKGDDTSGNGTKASPYKTLGKALASAGTTGKVSTL